MTPPRYTTTEFLGGGTLKGIPPSINRKENSLPKPTLLRLCIPFSLITVIFPIYYFLSHSGFYKYRTIIRIISIQGLYQTQVLWNIISLIHQTKWSYRAKISRQWIQTFNFDTCPTQFNTRKKDTAQKTTICYIVLYTVYWKSKANSFYLDLVWVYIEL